MMLNFYVRLFWLMCVLLVALPCARAAPFGLHPLFKTNMVLQRSISVPVWGQAGPGETVVVTFEGQTRRTQANEQGEWQVILDALKPGGPFILHATSGARTLDLPNVLVGDVWVCSGQSNMEYPVKAFRDAATWLKDADYPAVRLFTVKPNRLHGGEWQVCSPETAVEFSATAFFFGTKLQQHLNIPIGLISSAVSGSTIQPWMNAVKPGHGSLFRSMVLPLLPFAIKGVAWYQGESNAMFAHGEPYRRMLRTLIMGWRAQWGQGDFPFLIVQLPNYGKSNGTWPELRESQAVAAVLPNVGYITTIDVGEADNIHPNDKQPVGRRLALLARHLAYGEEVVYAGPTYRSMQVGDDGRITIQFQQVGSGLVTNDGAEPRHFRIAGENQRFLPAQAAIKGDAVSVWSEKVATPVAVRYAWLDNPEHVNLVNNEGLPAAPFRTDDWRLRTQKETPLE